MNLHVVQSETARAEVAELMSVPSQIVSPQSNRPLIGLVQDALAGSYLFSSRGTFLTREDVMQLVMQLDHCRGDVDALLLQPALLVPQRLWTGKQVLSLLFPAGFNLDRYVRNGTASTESTYASTNERKVVIHNGQLVCGSLCKQTLGTTSGGIIHLLCNDYCGQMAADFINDIQKMINLWLANQGFSARLSDCVIDAVTQSTIQDVIQKAFDYVRGLEDNPNLPSAMKENCVQKNLANVRDFSAGIVMKTMTHSNSYHCMAMSGSKGGPVNISQIMAVVGQQSVNGQRIGIGGVGRVLSHFPTDPDEVMHPITRGFVTHSFIQGLTPTEFFFHAMGGREGLVDTAVKTAETGYIQRRLTKAMEGLQVREDHTVRDAQDHIVEFAYGTDMMDASKVEKASLAIVKMSDAEVVQHFALTDAEIAQHTQTPTEASRWKQVSDNEVKDLLWLRDQLRQSMLHLLLPRVDCSIFVTVPLKRMIESAKRRDGEPVTPFTAATLVSLCCVELARHGQSETFYLRSYIKTMLCCRACVVRHKLSVDSLDWLLTCIKHRFLSTAVAPGEMVGSIAASSIGEPCTQMSVHPNELIYVKDIREHPDGTVQSRMTLCTIGSFVKECLTIWPSVQQGDTTTAKSSNNVHLLTLSVSPTEQVEWKEVTGVTQHPPNGSLLKVTTQRGRSVTATMAKSWLVRRHDRVVPIDGDQLQLGDYLPVLRRSNVEMTDASVNIRVSDVYPFEDMPDITVDADLGFLMGFYFADSTTAVGEMVSITHPSEECLERLQRYGSGLNRNCVVNDSWLFINSRALVRLLQNQCGEKWPVYKVPQLMFQGLRGVLLGYLDGLLCAAMAHSDWNGLKIQTDDINLHFDMVHILSMLDIVPILTDDGVLLEGTALLQLYRTVSLTWPKLQQWVQQQCSGITLNEEYVLPTDNGVVSAYDTCDIVWDCIDTIETVEPDCQWVYDLSVEDNATFVVGSGIFMMDTLNTFHYAGIAGKNVTLGVPRMKEIVDASKKLKTPQVTVFLKPPLCHNELLADKLRESLVWTPLHDVVQHSEIVWDPDDTTDTELMQLNTPFLPFCQPELPGASRYVVRFVLNQDRMMDKGLEPVDIARCVQYFVQSKAAVIYSETNMEQWLIRARLGCVQDMVNRIQGSDTERQQTEKSILQREHQRMLNDVIVSGVQHVTSAELKLHKYDAVDRKTGALVTKEEWGIIVNGPVLDSILQVEGVDTNRTLSNNAIEVAKIFGIEAAVGILFHEIQKVLSFDGTYVNYRHILALVNTMTHRDFIMPMNRHGINRVDVDLALKASFEESVEMLYEGAAYREQVPTKKAVTANIILGQRVPIGTGSVTVIDCYTGMPLKEWDLGNTVNELSYTGLLVETLVGHDPDFVYYDPVTMPDTEPMFKIVPAPPVRPSKRQKTDQLATDTDAEPLPPRPKPKKAPAIIPSIHFRPSSPSDFDTPRDDRIFTPSSPKDFDNALPTIYSQDGSVDFDTLQSLLEFVRAARE